MALDGLGEVLASLLIFAQSATGMLSPRIRRGSPSPRTPSWSGRHAAGLVRSTVGTRAAKSSIWTIGSIQSMRSEPEAFCFTNWSTTCSRCTEPSVAARNVRTGAGASERPTVCRRAGWPKRRRLHRFIPAPVAPRGCLPADTRPRLSRREMCSGNPATSAGAVPSPRQNCTFVSSCMVAE